MLRKDYIKKKVAPKEGIGMFLAERVLKTWHEDFVDQDTQEIVSIERNEVLYDRDKKVDSKMAKDIEEYGITEICVTNTPGRAEELRTFCRLGHVKVTMKGITKTGVVICRAESIRQAMDLAADYTEGATEEVLVSIATISILLMWRFLMTLLLSDAQQLTSRLNRKPWKRIRMHP